MKIIIPLGCKTEENLENIAAENNGRIQNWRHGEATLDVVPTGRILTHNCGRYSRNCSYTKWEYTPIMTSFGVIAHAGTALCWQIGSEGGVMFAPRGFIFSSDSLGLKFCAAKNSKKDFHFSTDDILFCENPMKISWTWLVKIGWRRPSSGKLPLPQNAKR